MVLVMDTDTGEIKELDRTEADVILDPKAFINVFESIAPDKWVHIDISPKGRTMYNYNCWFGQVMLPDVIRGRFKVLPNTPASRTLYGGK